MLRMLRQGLMVPQLWDPHASHLHVHSHTAHGSIPLTNIISSDTKGAFDS